MIAAIEADVVAADGYAVAARFFSPAMPMRGAVLLAPALGVPQRFYAPLAEWLASEGFLVATFDYRGIGRSRRHSLRKLRADLLDWARLDCRAVLEELVARANGAPLTWVGHSLGGQILPFVPGVERLLAGVITIGTGSGYWRENALPLRRYVWLLWYVLMPAATWLCGYFPGKRLRMVGDLPKGVALQWRRWCLHPDYAVGAEKDARHRFAAVRAPVTAVSFTDDEFMSEQNTASLHAFYVNARVTRKRLAPREVGLRRIGHFGFFREAHRDVLWRLHLLPLLA